MIHIRFDQLSIVEILRLVRKFVIHFEPEQEYASSRMTAEKARRMLKFMTEKHVFDVCSVETGILL